MYGYAVVFGRDGVLISYEINRFFIPQKVCDFLEHLGLARSPRPEDREIGVE